MDGRSPCWDFSERRFDPRRAAAGATPTLGSQFKNGVMKFRGAPETKLTHLLHVPVQLGFHALDVLKDDKRKQVEAFWARYLMGVFATAPLPAGAGYRPARTFGMKPHVPAR